MDALGPAVGGYAGSFGALRTRHSHIEEALTRLHNIEVIVGADLKERKDWVQHLTVLGRDADDGLDPCLIS